MISVYKITNTVTEKACVGITSKTTARRWAQHLYTAPKGQAMLHRSINKHGAGAFVVELLYEAVDRAEAARVERGLIAQYGTYAPGGYNLTSGGEKNVGFYLAPEVRAKQRAGRLGKKHSKEAREKIRVAHVGMKRSPESCAKQSARNKLGWTPAMRAAITAAQQTPEYRAKMRAASAKRGKHEVTVETRAKISAASKRQFSDSANRERAAEVNRRQFADPVKRARHAEAMRIWREQRATKGGI